ncbi:MAG TPA: heavy-metal-associated domain-containing protein [Vicinamibacterales bacterium]|nr:heavy-metal-associated domain-containing protein [Vicinamibacterales bacterium]
MSRLANLLRRLGIQRRTSIRGATAANAPLADVAFRIPNMVCEGCAEKIDGALHAIAGVCEIRSNVAQKRIVVRYEPGTVRPEKLKDAVNRAGFTVVEG